MGELGALRNELLVAPGSFTEGGQVQTKNQVLHDETGIYLWGGALPKVVPAGSTVISAGGIGDGLWKPASIAGFMQEISNVIYYARPEEFGGVGDGVHDDTDAVQKAMNAKGKVSMHGKNWLISDTITIPDGKCIDIGSSTITAKVAGKPLFRFTGKELGMSMKGDSGIIIGEADSFLELEGNSYTPVNADYVKQVRLSGIHVSSTKIDKAIKMEKAVRQVYIDDSMFYTVNGIVANGKHVEITCHKTIIYGSDNTAPNTVGIKLTSPGGSNFYNEGWHFTDCTLDNFENTLDVYDVYVLTVTGGYLATNSATGFAMRVNEPTTTHCRDIIINAQIGGKIKFMPKSRGISHHARISGVMDNLKSGIAIEMSNNSSDIDVSGIKIVGDASNITAVVGNNCHNVVFSNVANNASMGSGIQFKGANGSGCAVHGFNHVGAGVALWLERPVALSGVRGIGAAQWMYKSTNIVGGTKPASSELATITMKLAKGTRGFITYGVSFSGATDGATIGLASIDGVTYPTGSGWNGSFSTLEAGSGNASRTIPFDVTKDVDAVFTLKNVGSTPFDVRHGHSILSVVII